MLGGIPLPGAAVYINDAAIHNRLWRSAVSAAGPIGTALSVVLLSIPFWLWNPDKWEMWIGQGSWLGGVWAALAFLIFLNIYMVFLNSLPIPPLDGFGVLRPWLPPPLQAKARKMSQYGILIVFGLLWFVQPFNQLLMGVAITIAELVGVPSVAIAAGHASFRTSSTPIVVLVMFTAYSQPNGYPYQLAGKQPVVLASNGMPYYPPGQQQQQASQPHGRTSKPNYTQGYQPQQPRATAPASFDASFGHGYLELGS